MRNHAEHRSDAEPFQHEMETQSPSGDRIRNRKLEVEVACQKKVRRRPKKEELK